MFGVANALFSGLALAGIVISLWLQQQELKSQQTDINEQKKEIKLQRFETTLFSQLNFHMEIVDGIYYKDKTGGIIKGRMAFEHFYNILINKNIDSIHEYKQEGNLIHYFKNIYRTIKWVDKFKFEKDSEKNKVKKYQYVKTIRSKVSIYELLLIYYFGLTNDEKLFKNLIEEYSFLKNIPKSFKEYQSKPSCESDPEDFKESLGYHIQAFHSKAELDKKFWKQEKDNLPLTKSKLNPHYSCH